MAAKPKPRRRMVSKQLAKFEVENQTVVGVLTVKDTQTLLRDGEPHEIGRYEITNDLGTMIVNGTTQIDEALESVKIGETVEILYLGEQQTSRGFTVKKFEVYVHEVEGNDNAE